MADWRETISGRTEGGRTSAEPAGSEAQDRAARSADGANSRPSDTDRESNWADLPAREADPRRLAKNRIVTLDRHDPAHATFDVLRTRVLQVLRENDWKTVAITSPTPECGKTVVALNLAFSLAHQKDCRTVLLDLDLRRPQIGRLLGLPERAGMEMFLNGTADLDELLIRFGDNLAIGANGRTVGDAAELLQSAPAASALRDLRQRLEPDVVLFDLPPLLCGDDVLGFLPSVDCAILVVAAGSTQLAEVDLCEEDISAKTNMLGVVLNKCWYEPPSYYGLPGYYG